MAKPHNIECFEMAAAALLATLYETFPKPIHISSAKLEEDLVRRLLIPQECVWTSKQYGPIECLTGSTLLWLADEGLVRYAKEDSQRFSGVVLTAKGYASLNSPILRESGGETYGSAIMNFASNALTSGLSSTLSGLIRSTLTQ